MCVAVAIVLAGPAVLAAAGVYLPDTSDIGDIGLFWQYSTSRLVFHVVFQQCRVSHNKAAFLSWFSHLALVGLLGCPPSWLVCDALCQLLEYVVRILLQLAALDNLQVQDNAI